MQFIIIVAFLFPFTIGYIVNNNPQFLTKNQRILIRRENSKFKPILVAVPAQVLLKYQNLKNQINKTASSEIVNNVNLSSETNELPQDLRDLAITLGFPNEESLPDLDVISGLLGTTSREETIKLIRDIASTQDGLETMRSYLQIFLQTTSSSNSKDSEENDSNDKDTDLNKKDENKYQSESYVQPSKVPIVGGLIDRTHTNVQILNNVITTPKPDLGFFSKLTSWMSYFKKPNNQVIPLNTTYETNDSLDNEIQTHTETRLPVTTKPSSYTILVKSKPNKIIPYYIRPVYYYNIPSNSIKLQPINNQSVPLFKQYPSSIPPHVIKKSSPIFTPSSMNSLYYPSINTKSLNYQQISDIPLTKNYYDYPHVKESEAKTSYDSPIIVSDDNNNSSYGQFSNNQESETVNESNIHESTELPLKLEIIDKEPKSKNENENLLQNKISLSEPQRVSGYELYATGKIHKANIEAIDILVNNLNTEIKTTQKDIGESLSDTENGKFFFL